MIVIVLATNMATMYRGCEPRINRCCVELQYGTVLADLKRDK